MLSTDYRVLMSSGTFHTILNDCKHFAAGQMVQFCLECLSTHFRIAIASISHCFWSLFRFHCVLMIVLHHRRFLEKIGLNGLTSLLEAYSNKTAYAQCVFGYCAGHGAEPILFDAHCAGIIVSARGPANFGWDAVFQPLDGDGKTFAEMDSQQKNVISHRAKAIQMVRAFFEKQNQDQVQVQVQAELRPLNRPLGDVHNLRSTTGECPYSDWLWNVLRESDKGAHVIAAVAPEANILSDLTSLIWQYTYEPQDPWEEFLCTFPVNAEWGSQDLRAWWSNPESGYRNWHSLLVILKCLSMCSGASAEGLKQAKQVYAQNCTSQACAVFQWFIPSVFYQQLVSRVLDAIIEGSSASGDSMGLSNFGHMQKRGRVIANTGTSHDGVVFHEHNDTVFYAPYFDISYQSKCSCVNIPVSISIDTKTFMFVFSLDVGTFQTGPQPRSSTYVLHVRNHDELPSWVTEQKQRWSESFLKCPERIDLPWQNYAKQLVDNFINFRRESMAHLGMDEAQFAKLCE